MNNIKVLSDYIKAVTKNVVIDNTIELDLVLSGGAFNGMFGLGNILFIKQLEREKKINVNRVSGCSVGAVLGLVYLTDNFDETNNVFNNLKNCLKEKGNLKCLKNIIVEGVNNIFKTDEEMKEQINGRLYINYNDISDCNYCVISEYDNKEHLIECLLRSMYIPFLIDGNLKIDDKYIDGIVPYIFKNSSRKILYLEMMKDYTDIIKCVVTQNEKNQHYRILQGVTDASRFFTNGRSERLTWYEDWNTIKIIKHHILYLSAMIIVVFIDFLSSINIPSIICNNKLYKLSSTVIIKSCKDILGKLNY